MAERAKKTIGCGLGLVLASLSMGHAAAADLDRPYYRHRPLPPDVAFLSPPPSCKLVPEPQMNLFNEVTRYGVQRVCITRGVYTDSYWPYAPPYWWPNPRKGYGF